MCVHNHCHVARGVSCRIHRCHHHWNIMRHCRSSRVEETGSVVFSRCCSCSCCSSVVAGTRRRIKKTGYCRRCCCCSVPREHETWQTCSREDNVLGPTLDRRWLLGCMVAMTMPVGQALAREPLTETYRSSAHGFEFSYPESFVVAFDRTGKNIGDGAVVSVGDFTRFITVTVFASPVPAGVDGILDVETGYDVCIRPIVESETTLGFRVIREEMKGASGVFDFEYDHSICRGEQIEGSGGVLRCIVRVFIYSVHVCMYLMDIHMWV